MQNTLGHKPIVSIRFTRDTPFEFSKSDRKNTATLNVLIQ